MRPVPPPAAVQPLRGSETSLELRGAAVMQTVMQRAAEALMATRPEAIVTVGGGNADLALKALIVGVCEVAMATSELPDDWRSAAADRAVKLSRVDVFRDAIVPVVDPRNPVEDLSLADLRRIFRGAITNWRDVGGEDAPIVLVSHEHHTGYYETFRERVMGAEAVILTSAKIVPGSEYAGAITGNAIGYLGFRRTAGRKALSVGGVRPSIATLKDESYPIHRTSSLWLREPHSKLADALVQLVASATGQAIIDEEGFLPSPASAP